LRKAIANSKPGDEIEVETYRGDDRRTIDVKLGKQPTSPG
jgi:S1-C subfamily serine protease